MLADKFAWAGLTNVAGFGFVAFGLANLGGFGLSLVMDKQNFDYHFAYKGQGKLLQPLKSMIAAESITNVGWTAPSLILGGAFLQRACGN